MHCLCFYEPNIFVVSMIPISTFHSVSPKTIQGSISKISFIFFLVFQYPRYILNQTVVISVKY